jgi:hypothetical protein
LPSTHAGRSILGLFWQIVVFLIVTAALGFAIGWLVRGARLEGARAAVPRSSGAENASPGSKLS